MSEMDIVERAMAQRIGGADGEIVEGLCNEIDSLRSELSRLAAENEGLKRDAERYRWLRGRYIGAHFDFDDNGMCVIAFEIPADASVSASIDATVDRATPSAALSTRTEVKP